ncbi:hypothetical protein D9758_015790 [Tetrapyrgos nigripes]|uniref:DUF6593 domain-containing protein n=1 Tax=Tetrapyrgos nigripes TaxID=182062 RepID=A0A8H5FFE7_9AGAR|nr:hypothetical protein D9758_015790 [Tetrapyrgos nigripes]
MTNSNSDTYIYTFAPGSDGSNGNGNRTHNHSLSAPDLFNTKLLDSTGKTVYITRVPDHTGLKRVLAGKHCHSEPHQESFKGCIERVLDEDEDKNGNGPEKKKTRIEVGRVEGMHAWRRDVMRLKDVDSEAGVGVQVGKLEWRHGKSKLRFVNPFNGKTYRWECLQEGKDFRFVAQSKDRSKDIAIFKQGTPEARPTLSLSFSPVADPGNGKLLDLIVTSLVYYGSVQLWDGLPSSLRDHSTQTKGVTYGNTGFATTAMTNVGIVTAPAPSACTSSGPC